MAGRNLQAPNFHGGNRVSTSTDKDLARLNLGRSTKTFQEAWTEAASMVHKQLQVTGIEAASEREEVISWLWCCGRGGEDNMSCAGHFAKWQCESNQEL